LKGAGWLTLALVACGPVVADAASREPGSSKSAKAKETRTGLATYYGAALEGRKTASGEIFDKEALVAAHPTYPFGTRVRVTNLTNVRTVDVRITDRGPSEARRRHGVIIDLSQQAATNLGFRKKGKTRVKVDVLEWGEEKARGEKVAELPTG